MAMDRHSQASGVAMLPVDAPRGRWILAWRTVPAENLNSTVYICTQRCNDSLYHFLASRHVFRRQILHFLSRDLMFNSRYLSLIVYLHASSFKLDLSDSRNRLSGVWVSTKHFWEW